MLTQVSREEFLRRSPDEVAAMVREAGRPRSVMVVMDGSRRYLLIEKGLSPEEAAARYAEINHAAFRAVVKEVFRHGIETLFVPGTSKAHLLKRGGGFRDMILAGVKEFCTGKEFLDLFRSAGARVRLYGDLEFVEELGYPGVREWAASLRDATSGNGPRRLFLGVGHGMREEEERLVRIGIAFHGRHGRAPTRDELIVEYFGEPVEPLDLFIRPTEVRDSNVQPVLIGGRAEMYFPVVPAMELDGNHIRLILHDYLYNRVITHGGKTYSSAPPSREFLRRYYEKNKYTILGLGSRTEDGEFWYPEG